MEDDLRDFPFEFVKPFVTSFNELHRSGVYIFKSNNIKWYQNLRGHFVMTCIVTLSVALNVYFTRLFMGKIDIYELSYMIAIYLVSQFAVVKGIFILIKRPVIRSLILEIGSTWRTENLTEEQINKKNTLLNKLNFFHKVYLWIHWSGVVQYMLPTLLEVCFRRFILQQDYEFTFPFECSYPFNPKRNWLIYISIYVFQVFSISLIMSWYMAYDTLFITLCSHLTIEFNLLQEDVLHTVPVLSNTHDAGDQISQGSPNIKVIVRRHQRLIEMTQKLDGIYNGMIFINLLIVTVTACFFAFAGKILHGRVELFKNIIGVLASLLPVFNFCYYGELLAGANAGVGDSAYNSMWYNGNELYKKAVLFIIMRSQKTCRLTALGYAPITLNTFSRVLTTTWSYFSLITSMYEEEK